MELRQILRLLWRRRGLVLWVFAGVFVSLTLLTLLCETQYVSSAKVYLYHSPNKSSMLARVSLDSPAVNSASLTDTERATYEDLAITVPVVTPLIDDLHLTRKRKSLQVLEYIPLVRLVIDRFWPNLGRRPMTYEELANKSLVHVIFPRPYLKAAMMEDSDILEFSTSAESMELAIDLANAAAKSFVARETAMRQGECRLLAEGVGRELPKAKAAYEEALAALRDTRQHEKVVDLTSEGEQIVSRYFTLSADRDANRLNLIKSQGMLANVKAQLAKRPEFRKTSESTQRSSLIDSVKLTLRDLYMDLASAKSRMTPEHPAVKEIENKIEEAKRIIKGEALKVFGSETVSTDPTFSYLNERTADYTAQVAGYESQDAAFATLIGEVEQKAHNFPNRSAAVALVTVRVDAGQLFMSNLNQLYAMAQAGEGLDLSIAHLVEPASIPGKIDDYMRPKLSLMLAAGLCVGLFLGVIAALVAAYADETVTSRQALVEAGTTPLAAVPRPGGVSRGQGLRRLRDALLPAGPDVASPRVVVVAAPDDGGDGGRGDGDEALEVAGIALGLAEAVARGGRGTLAVDADLRRPSLFRLAGLPLGPGLAEVLSGEASLDAVIVPGGEPHLFVLPAGAVALAAPDADRLLDGPALERTLAGLAERFEVVVVLAAPLGRFGDALTLGRLADAVVLVPRLYRTRAAALAGAASEVLLATGRPALAVLSGVAEDDRTPGQEWDALRKRLSWRKTVRQQV